MPFDSIGVGKLKVLSILFDGVLLGNMKLLFCPMETSTQYVYFPSSYVLVIICIQDNSYCLFEQFSRDIPERFILTGLIVNSQYFGITR